MLGADDGGESNLTYTWATTGTPPAAVTFSTNGTNAAKNTTAGFTRAGTYNFVVTITDSGGLLTTSSVSVTVSQTTSIVAVSPGTLTIAQNAQQQFFATAIDQFGVPLATQPGFTWALGSGVGSINASGLYTAAGVNGTATVTATSGSVTGTPRSRSCRHRPADHSQAARPIPVPPSTFQFRRPSTGSTGEAATGRW